MSAIGGIIDMELAKQDKLSAVIALKELIAGAKDLETTNRVRYLFAGFRLAMQLKQPDLAKDALEASLASARELLKDDESGDDPNAAPKAFWPSTVAFEALIYGAGRLDPALAQDEVQNISDFEVQTFAKLALAAALSDLPPLPSENMMSIRRNKDRGFVSLNFNPPR